MCWLVWDVAWLHQHYNSEWNFTGVVGMWGFTLQNNLSTHLHTLIPSWLLLDLKLFCLSASEALTVNTVRISQGLSECVIGATKDMKTMWHAHLTWECLEKNTHGWLSACWDRRWQWWVTAASWEPARCMCCGVLVFGLFRLSDSDLVAGVWLYF